MKILKRFIDYLKPFWKSALLGPLLMLIEVASDLSQPFLTQKIIDNGIAKGNLNYVFTMGSLMIFLACFGLLGGIGSVIFSTIASQNFGTNLRQHTFDKIQGLSFGNLDRLSSGNLIVRLTNDVTQLQNFIMMLLRILLKSPIMFIGSLIMSYITAPKLTPIILIIIPIIIISLYFVIKISYPLFYKTQDSLDSINTLINENLNGVRLVKAFVKEDFELDKFKSKNKSLVCNTIKSSRTVSIILPMLMLIINLGIICILWFGGNLFINNSIELGQIVAFINYLMQLMFALIIAGMLLMSVSRALVSAKRIEEILNEEPDIQNNSNIQKNINICGNVDFQNVSFSYSNDLNNLILKNISFTVNKGETIGIVGAIGSGKSTLVQLIPRFYDTTEGNILIDNINIKNINLNTLRNSIGFVLQKALIFSGTIDENIKQGNKTAKKDEVENAAKVAQAHEFIERFHEKYETTIFQKGSNLSGGQKQRLSIARGIVKKPKILILDDSTSALDAKSEELVKRALENSLGDTTIFLVAQKISSICHADKILVLNKGELVGCGTHKELLKTNDIYKEIYNSQKGEGENTNAKNK